MTGIILFLTACSSVEPFSYQPELKQYKKTDLSLSLTIPPFYDARPRQNNINGVCTLGVVYIPLLVPYCTTIDSHRPENANYNVELNVSEDFAKLTAKELENAVLFKSVVAGDADDGLILKATVKKMYLNKKQTAYGLTYIGGFLLGVLGAPLKFTDWDFEIEYRLISLPDTVLFEKTYTFHEEARQGFYTVKKHSFVFDGMLKKANLELIADLKAALPDIKARLKTTKK